ncbi:hypothetical protein [Aliamphritea spongicola]|nr:hypothetical protein [Aliamphritea spongicola]
MASMARATSDIIIAMRVTNSANGIWPAKDLFGTEHPVIHSLKGLLRKVSATSPGQNSPDSKHEKTGYHTASSTKPVILIRYAAHAFLHTANSESVKRQPQKTAIKAVFKILKSYSLSALSDR